MPGSSIKNFQQYCCRQEELQIAFKKDLTTEYTQEPIRPIKRGIVTDERRRII
jgi:hypothetical protein